MHVSNGKIYKIMRQVGITKYTKRYNTKQKMAYIAKSGGCSQKPLKIEEINKQRKQTLVNTR